MKNENRILFCHCSYARTIPKDVKAEVLQKLAVSNRSFDAVADLCEMSAQKDDSLKRLAADGPLKIIACYPRAVKWLFDAAGAPLPDEDVSILNMREMDAAAIAGSLGIESAKQNQESQNRDSGTGHEQH